MLKDLCQGDLITSIVTASWDTTRCYLVNSEPRLENGVYHFSVRCVQPDGETDYFPNGGWDDNLMMRWPVSRFRVVPQGDPWEEPPKVDRSQL